MVSPCLEPPDKDRALSGIEPACCRKVLQVGLFVCGFIKLLFVGYLTRKAGRDVVRQLLLLYFRFAKKGLSLFRGLGGGICRKANKNRGFDLLFWQLLSFCVILCV